MAETELTDPLGRRIVLHNFTWFGPIVKGHPEMRNERRRAQEAVQSPAQIRFSASDPDCGIYYDEPDTAGIRIAVIADVRGGFVKTAYPAAKLK